MKPIDKFFRRLSHWEKLDVQKAIDKLVSGNWDGLDIKKLKGVVDMFRARKGEMRIIYRLEKSGKITVIEISRRNDTTYNF